MYAPTTKPGKAYQTVLKQMESSLDDAFSCLQNYTDTVSLQQTARAVGGDAASLDSFSSLVTDELLAAKRTRAAGTRAFFSRNLADPTVETEEVTLAEELQEISDEFSALLETMVPDLSRIEEVPGLAMDEGMIVMYDDSVLDPASLPGIIAVEIINAQLDGQDIEAILEDMGAVEETAFGGESEESARGVYKDETSRWQFNTISYMIDSGMPQLMESDIRSAIAEWKRRVPKLSFSDKTDDDWYQFLATIYTVGLLDMKSKSMSGAAGRSSVGAGPGIRTFNIDPKIYDTTQYLADWRLRVPRHELGHTIGLGHEHQRWDRDAYLTANAVDMSGDNWVKIDRQKTVAYIPYTEWRSRVVKFWWGRTRIYYPVFLIYELKKDVAFATSIFDYRSLMLYSTRQISSLRTRVAQQGLPVGAAIPFNTEISDLDVQIVRKMYGF